MPVSTPDFSTHLHNAHIVGVGYGLLEHKDCGVIPTITLLCEHQAHAQLAWDVIRAWTNASGGDGLKLTWVLSSRQDHRLLLGPEDERLMYRCIGFDRLQEPTLMMVTHIKRLDTTGDALLQFRDYSRSWYSPYEFNLAVVGPTGPSLLGEGILKFEAFFHTEEDLAPDAPERYMLGLAKGKPSYPNIEHDARDRNILSVLATRFPVTIARAKREGSPVDWNTYKAHGIAPIRVEQAIANLVISHQLCGQPHFAGIEKSQLNVEVVRAVARRFEEADGKPLPPTVIPENITQQVVLDTKASLSSSESKRCNSLVDVAAAMRQRPRSNLDETRDRS